MGGPIGCIKTVSTMAFIAIDCFEIEGVCSLHLSRMTFCLVIASTVDIFTFYVHIRHV